MQAARRTVSTRALERVARATAVSGLQDGPVLLLVVEDAPRAPHDTGERVFVDVDREPRLLVEHEVKSADERATAGHHDATNGCPRFVWPCDGSGTAIPSPGE